ncbi:MAG: type I DNA topoisomerase [Eubacteriales bacterium]|jgi:DNA topoisomerase-1|nr:type I DNA topoisomerase [Eubacteriales bacterium]
MADNLVIVESPAKAKTIKKYLGKNYSVMASMGHVRDLPKSTLGVDIENNFNPKYITIRGKGELMAKLKKEAKSAKKVYLATDPDREGEAISWHLSQALGIDGESTYRVVFNEITKTAVKNAVKNPRKIDYNLVDAQQARRVLDRIVGYKISPLLWKKVKKGLSAGRVQSVATRLIVDREREIEAFVPQEYWSLAAFVSQKESKDVVKAQFYGDEEKKIELKDEQQVKEILQCLQGAKYQVKSVKKGEKTRHPAPPFITSTLQQEASRKLNFSSRKTMQVAQQLYEGVEVSGMGVVGLITYMRTDSLRIADEAQKAALSYINEVFGAEFAPEKPRVYKTKKGAQDAHEAIRPTDVTITPDKIKGSVRPDIYKLYKLIWERFVASQMQSARFETVSCDILADCKSGKPYLFKANGSRLKFAGFMQLYVEGRDNDEEEEASIPVFNQGEVLTLHKLEEKQHFTSPPPRYTEATLIKAMEEEGIGRPSTYSPTITTILARGYVVKEGKALYPTELGTIVTDLMKEHFKDIVDIEFTANMEEQFDSIEEGKIPWVDVIKEFYSPFEDTLKKAEEEIGEIEIEDEVSDVPCDKCGRMMVYKMGRYGKFLACPGFPECRNAKPIVREAGVDCPVCGSKVLIKKSKRGKEYYGCENNPKCEFMSWDKPLDKKCPKCGKELYLKSNRRGDRVYCADKDCGYKEEVQKDVGGE